MTAAVPADLPSLLSPMALDDFLANHWNQRFAIIKGQSNKFAGLMDWKQLADLLETDIPLHRIMVAKEGSLLEQSRYITRPFMLPEGVLNLQALHNCLASGATLVLNGMERHAHSLRQLAANVERLLGADTCLNLYAGWRDTRGFELHWDGQDTMLMQVEGRKGWKVYAPTAEHPLKKHPLDPPKPTGSPAWEGVLETGDALYLPRGWWHVPEPVEGPSLHLTMTIEPPTGLRLIEWVAQQASSSPLLRRNVPFLADEETRKNYLKQLRDTLSASLDDDALTRFRRHCDANSESRGHLLWPHQSDGAMPSLVPQSRVRLATARALAFELHKDPLLRTVVANERRWPCPAAIVPALEKIRCDEAVSIGSLVDLCDPSASAALLRFLAMLSLADALTVETRNGD